MNAYQYYQQYLEDLKNDAKTDYEGIPKEELHMDDYVNAFPKSMEEQDTFRRVLKDNGLLNEFDADLTVLETKIKYANEDGMLNHEDQIAKTRDAYDSTIQFIRDLAKHFGEDTILYDELLDNYDEDDITVFDTENDFVMWYYDMDGLGYQKGVQDALRFETRQDWINSIKNDNTFDLDDGRIAVVLGL